MKSIAETVLIEEYERSIQHIKTLINQLIELPKGSLIHKKNYTYLRFREPGKKSPTDKYINSEELKLLEPKINKRKRLEKQLKNRLENIKFSRKALKIKEENPIIKEALILIHGRRMKNDR